MYITKQQSFLFLVLISLPWGWLAAQNISAPPGWTIKTAGQTIIIEPDDLPPGKSFRCEVAPPSAPSDDFQAWFISESDADARQFGSPQPGAQINSMEDPSGHFFVRVIKVRADSGLIFVQYIARKPQQPGGMVRLGKTITNDGGMAQRYLAEALRIAGPAIMDESASTSITPASTSGGRIQGSRAPQPSATGSKQPATNLPRVKAPATGYRIILEMEFPIGFGGMPQAKQIPYLLLADGQVVKYPELPLDEFDVEAFKRQRNSIWGRWRQSGKKILVTWPDGKTSELDQHIETVPGRPDQRLDAVYHHYSGASAPGNYNTGWSVMEDYRFRRDGTFETDRGATISGGTIGGEVYAMGNNSRSNTGTYRIDGNVIEFQYRDGRRERRLFYFGVKNGGQDSLVIGIGSSIYYEQDK